MQNLSDKAPSRVLFVGNIPYELSDEEVYEIMKSMGPVSKFRLVHDQKNNNRSKGYCFVEFATLDVAISACQAFKTLQIGTRTLRADFTKEFTGVSVIPGAPPVPSGYSQQQQHQQHMQHQPQQHQQYQQFQQGFGQKKDRWQKKPTGFNDYQQPPPPPRTNLDADDSVSKILSQVNPQQLTEFFQTIPGLVKSNPEQVAMILQSQQALAYASFQALLLMGLTGESVLSVVATDPNMPFQEIIARVRNAKPNDVQANGGQNERNDRPERSNDRGRPTQDPRQNRRNGNSNATNNVNRRDPRKQLQQQQQVNKQPMQQPQQMTSAPSMQQGPRGGSSGLDANNAALLSQVMQLTDEQIRTLPEDQRNMIRMLKANYQR